MEVPTIWGLRVHSTSKPVGFLSLVPESVQHPQMVLTSQDPNDQALPFLTPALFQQTVTVPFFVLSLSCPSPKQMKIESGRGCVAQWSHAHRPALASVPAQPLQVPDLAGVT